jgi:hypothetical protein
LFISNDNVRKIGDDFDVRAHAHAEERNKFEFLHLQDNIYQIRSVTNPNHFLFCSNDQVRKLGNDFDVRTHTFIEDRNHWLIS